ncbi:hypothetical protein [uncultured Roseovarius sp.]|uniref:hypothetical protein n=1 Tax=uncultured Roseovarius sp. TaxID=293344 RepID=UPI0026153378|nr:hypothetical protein [uncultured Roseovarius sp.]
MNNFSFILIFGLPLVFLLYVLIVYLRWKSGSKPGERFSTAYWYTSHNPLHRSWWPIVALSAYFLIVVMAGLLLGE